MEDNESLEQLGLPLPELSVEETDEEVAGKLANKIFRPWYKEYYEGRYTQSTAFINKVLKQTVLKCVIQGQDDEETIRKALKILGTKQQVVTEASMQFALSRVRQENARRAASGAWSDEVQEIDFDKMFIEEEVKEWQ